MRVWLILFVLITKSQLYLAQDSLYTRQVIQFLTSEKCAGRGYVQKGLKTAEKFITVELKKNGCDPLFNKSYSQSFYHTVNTFPSKCEVKINESLLKPGYDYILNPSSKGLSGRYNLSKVDSTHYQYTDNKTNLSIIIKNKLTYSVGHEQKPICEIELKKTAINNEPQQISVEIKNKLIHHFKSQNIGCFIKGTSKSDSCIVFSAHYDHLGMMGKTCYFPGANDNASGVSMLLNLIKYYSINPPKYKTVFLFFAGEEAGLLGSKHFVESNCFDLKSIKFLINLDLLGTGDDGIMVVNGAIYQKEFDLMNQINNNKQFVKQIKKRGKAANSDHYWFTEAGVPAFFIYTMGGITAYHDVFDIEKTLPLSDYKDVFNLIIDFTSSF